MLRQRHALGSYVTVRISFEPDIIFLSLSSYHRHTRPKQKGSNVFLSPWLWRGERYFKSILTIRYQWETNKKKLLYDSFYLICCAGSNTRNAHLNRGPGGRCLALQRSFAVSPRSAGYLRGL